MDSLAGNCYRLNDDNFLFATFHKEKGKWKVAFIKNVHGKNFTEYDKELEDLERVRFNTKKQAAMEVDLWLTGT